MEKGFNNSPFNTPAVVPDINAIKGRLDGSFPSLFCNDIMQILSNGKYNPAEIARWLIVCNNPSNGLLKFRGFKKYLECLKPHS